MFNLSLNRYYSPPDAPASGVTEEMNKEDINDFLKDDTKDDKLDIKVDEDDKANKEVKLDKGKLDKEDDEIKDIEEDDSEQELAELEAELEGPTEEQLELTTPVRRKEILAKYPNLFKEFPYLEKAYYREQQFTELLPTIQDAKDAVRKSQVFDSFEADILGGNTKDILSIVKRENPDGFNKIVDNYLGTLAEVDDRAYHHVLANISKHTIMAMAREAKTSQNEALQNAAQILNQFVFGSSNFTPPTKLGREPGPQDQQVNQELVEREQRFIQQQVEGTRNDLNTRINNTLMNTIESNIDPKSSMSDYVRRNACKDAMDTLSEFVSKDARFRALADRLWENALQNNFSPESVGKIKAAYLSKAKVLLPTVIKKARQDALRGMGRRVQEDNDSNSSDKDESPSKSKNDQPRSNRSGKVTKASDIPRGVSTLDFLMSD